ncbi:porin family protein [Emticicia sp. TH156]|uniref:porin family protein n=1 Tax=Emticicia sp. TH156 TaxID=2067454 RepID=UPI000C790300|nr:porin family protein [Emticicia sp. TH156]PLK44455.1 PorT family protein [Emticicia sp. TH156]
MKKLVAIAAVVSLFTIKSFGQSGSTDARENLVFGLKAGTNFSNIYDSNNDDYTADGKFGFAGGAFLAIPLGKYLGLQPEVLYSQRGFRQSGTFFGSNYELTRTTHSVDIPLLVSIKPSSLITIQVGPQYSYLMRQNDVFKNFLGTSAQEQEFTNDNIRKNTLSAVGGIDFNFDKFVIGTRAGWDVQNNNGDGTSTNPRYKNAWVQATIGFRFW